MNYKKQLTIPLILLSLSTFSSATNYFDGEDGTVGNWKVYDNEPTGAVVSNVIDEIKNSKVIEFEGDTRRNSYMLGSRDWNNRTEKYLKWSMKFSEKFKITVYLKTKKGVRTLFYVYKNKDKGLYQKRYIKFGLGSKSMNGKWQDYSRDIEADLKKYEPDNELIKVKGMKVQGSGRIDDVRLEKKGDTNPCVTRKELQTKLRDNKDVSSVNTSCIKDMSKLFRYNNSFNGDISSWDVSNVTNMEGIFYWAENFNQDISKWDVSNVTNMKDMFTSAIKFNQDISNWDVSNVKNMDAMLYGTKSFKNQDLSKWNIENVETHTYFLEDSGKNNIEPNWKPYTTPEQDILIKAKEFCVDSKKSNPKFTKKILCPFEDNNLAYLLYERLNEPRVHDDVEYLVTASLDGTTDDFHILTSNNANNDRVGSFRKWINNSPYPGLINSGRVEFQYLYFFKNGKMSKGFIHEVLYPLIYMGTTSVDSINISDDKKTLTLTWKVILNSDVDKKYKIKDINKKKSSPYYKHVYDITDMKNPKVIKLENLEVDGELTLSSGFRTYDIEKN